MVTRNLAGWGVNPNTNKLDSRYDENGDVKMILIRSDTFDSSVDTAFYASEVGNYYISHDTTSIAGNSTGKVKLRFVGNASDTADAIAQLTFSLPAIFTELEFEYDLYIPENYSHTVPSDNANNNKFFRLWQTSYASNTSGNKCGASFFANDGNSDLKPECQHFGSGVSIGNGWGDEPATEFIGATDKGAWMHIKIHVLAPTVGANYSEGGTTCGNGFIRFYKNGVLAAYNDKLASIGSDSQGWQYGYLMGAANSGFRVDTDLYIDNLVIRGRP